MHMKWVSMGKRGLRKGFGAFLAVSLAFGTAAWPAIAQPEVVYAEEAAVKTITSMNYYSAADGPILSESGVGQASYGFVMPVFNNGAAAWEEIAADLQVNVKVNGVWVDIDQAQGFAYNTNWGHWSDEGFHGYWFTLSETTYLQLASKANPGVTLEYTLEFTNLTTTTITSLTATQGPELTAGATGGAGFTYPVFNGDTSIKYAQVASDLNVFVQSYETGEWVNIDNNAASGWIYDQNFGQFTDGSGGYWFTVNQTTKVRLASKSSPNVFLDYTITYNEPVRTNYRLSAAETTFTAGDTGAIGVPLPMIDGSYPVGRELDAFVYEIKVDGAWVELANVSLSGFSYQGNGYNKLSDKNQWGYWADGIYGLWFQPIQVDMELRFGYPLTGQKGGEVGDNYIYYTFIGNPNAPRPDVSDLGNIEIGTSDNSEIAGWNMIWNDEFSGNTLDTSRWNYNTGYYMSDDPNSWGWGNNELEYYTDSEKNVFLENGTVNLKTFYEPTTFPQDPNRVAPYSSGKITTKDKFAFKYGRIDFSAKLPAGTGLWPALWMLPNVDVYGGWASSGEIDVMEARGRLTGSTSGAIHYGGGWPNNVYVGADYSFGNGVTYDTDYHVYSAVWEPDNIKLYVDGTCFFKATSEQWYSLNAPNNPKAPFDQEFYIIMNLAVGGFFDGLLEPDLSDIPATLSVDYVRVYQAEGSTDGSFTDNSQNQPSVPVTGITLNKSSLTLTTGAQDTITKTVLPANATDTSVIWSSTNEAVATVNGGVVTGVSEGTCVITAITKDGGFSASCTVTVTPGGQGSIVNVRGDETCGLVRTDGKVEFYVNDAEFADLHYKVNNGGQLNVAMNSVETTSTGRHNYRYTVEGVTTGDTIEYFFTYNPGQGALDTAWQTFTLPAASDL